MRAKRYPWQVRQMMEEIKRTCFKCPICKNLWPYASSVCRTDGTLICVGCDDFRREQAGLHKFHMKMSIEQTKTELEIESEAQDDRK